MHVIIVCMTDLGLGYTGRRKPCFLRRRKPRTSARRRRREIAVVGLERRRLDTQTCPNCRWSAASERRSVRSSCCLPSQPRLPRDLSDRPALADLRLNAAYTYSFDCAVWRERMERQRADSIFLLPQKLTNVPNFKGSNGPRLQWFTWNFRLKYSREATFVAPRLAKKIPEPGLVCSKKRRLEKQGYHGHVIDMRGIFTYNTGKCKGSWVYGPSVRKRTGLK